MSVEQILRTIAERRLNLVTRGEALDAHISEGQLQRRAANGVLRRIYPGVYLFGGGSLSTEQRALAASLACGDGSFASGLTSAALWRILDDVEGEPEVTVPASQNPTTQGIVVRRSTSVGRGEQTMLGPIPIATVARTLLDLSRLLGEVELERACDNAFRLNLISPQRLLDYLKTKNNASALRRIASDRLRHGVHDTDFENDAERVLLAYGLPRPVRQYWFVAHGRKVRFDLAYPDERVAIEPNGQAPHWGRERWQADHDKRIAVKLAGVNMLEFTWDDIHKRPLYFVMTVGDALGLKPSRWVRKDSTRRSKRR